MADTKNLCAQIPVDLHRQVREHQEESGKSLGEYMTWLITTFYQTEEDKQMSSTETRTVAFQVPADLFEQFKAYLDRHHIRRRSSWIASSGRWRMRRRPRRQSWQRENNRQSSTPPGSILAALLLK